MKYTVVLVLSLISSLLLAQSMPIDSIPFELRNDNRIYTSLKVNGSAPLIFLFDTGASGMVINSESLSKLDMNFNSTVTNLGATGSNEVDLSTGNKVNWGGQEVKDIDFIAIPYPNNSWDGVLGLGVLRQFVVKVDYGTMFIYLYDRASYRNSNPNKLKINYAHDVPIVEVDIKMIDNRTYKLQLEIDTGSDRVIDLSTRYVNDHQLLNIHPKAFATSTISSSDGNSGKILNHYFPVVTIADYELYKIPGGLAQIEFGVMNIDGIDGIIGNWFLKRFNLTLDFENDYLYLEPNNNLHTAYYGFLTN